MLTIVPELDIPQEVEPLCPVFRQCGGCAYQHLSYATELHIKEAGLKTLLQEKLGVEDPIFHPIVGSPEEYHYRNRLDLTLRRTREGQVFGFQNPASRFVVPVEACFIGMKEISEFIPELKRQAEAKLPQDYRIANITVRTGQDGRVFWGGIGRRSLRMDEKNYFWTEIEGMKIFYSLDTFFQANLGILPKVVAKMRELIQPDKKTLFWDLYSGVGLFGLCFAGESSQVMMVEEAPSSVALARYNVAYHKLSNVDIRESKVEDREALALMMNHSGRQVALIDPPRRGLSEPALKALAGFSKLDGLLYLSCHPESLARDLEFLMQQGWSLKKIVPFDFFPRTQHLETLALLKRT